MKTNGFISYEELLHLEPYECVFVNRVYFFFLFAKFHHLVLDENVIKTFSKYLEIENMEEKLESNRKIKGYYLMNVEDIRLLISSIKQSPWSNAITKSDINNIELEALHEEIKNNYNEKFTKKDKIK